MTPDLFRKLVADASLAPSVHNVQPARWRLERDSVLLLEDMNVRLSAADPTGRDAEMSLGAAFEGFAMAAAEHGLSANYTSIDADTADLRPVARLQFAKKATTDPLNAYVETRQSWRGVFTPPTDADHAPAMGLTGPDCTVFTAPDTIALIAQLLDTASFGFMDQDDFRRELVSWMRLRKGHPRWGQDGLNAQAMQLGILEKLGAGVVTGVGFRPLAVLGLAAPLLAEAAKTTSAAAIVAFHRPQDEAPFESGRAFYRAWLRIEAAGFGAAVLAALADDRTSNATMAAMAGLNADQHLISAFRIGRRPDDARVPRARRALDHLIV